MEQRKRRTKIYTGPSGFAIMNNRFPVKRFLSQYPAGHKRPFLPVLYDFFGRSWKGVEAWLEEFWYQQKLLEFHLCFRNPDPNMARSARQIVRKLADINCPKTKLLICPILEDVADNKEWQQWAKKVRQAAPGIPLVRSSLSTKISGGRFEERHGEYPRYTNKPAKRTIANPDGCTTDFGDNEKYLYGRQDRHQFIMSPSDARRYIQRAKKSGRYAAAIWSAYQQGLQHTADWSSGLPVNQREFVVTDEAQEGMRQVLR